LCIKQEKKYINRLIQKIWLEMTKSPHMAIKRAFKRRSKRIDERAAIQVMMKRRKKIIHKEITVRFAILPFLTVSTSVQVYLNYILFVKRLASLVQDEALRSGQKRIDLRHLDAVAPTVLGEFRG